MPYSPHASDEKTEVKVEYTEGKSYFIIHHGLLFLV